MSYYLVRMGQGSRYIRHALEHAFIAIGWNEVPSLESFESVEDIRRALMKTSYGYSQAQLGINAGSIYRFGLEMKPDDIVLSPTGEREYAVGRVGKYFFDGSPKDGCPYKHRRRIAWLPQRISKEDMSTNLTYSLQSMLTVFSLDRYGTEIDALMSGEVPTPAEKPQRVRDVILESLMDLDGREFEEFIRHLLEVLGFRAEATQYVADKGIDVNGVLNAEGLADIVLRIQVKRVRRAIGNHDVLAIRGASAQSEHPCLITLSDFTAQAREEAEASGKTAVKLIGGDDLAAIILKHFDELDEDYRKRFSIRRKREVNIEEQFEIIGASEAAANATEIERGDQAPEWDTLICAAKEDGFSQAFLGQKAWWAVRLNPKTITFIKYLAMYQVSPVSQITYYGTVDKIEPYGSTGKYKLILQGDPIKLDHPVGLGKNRHLKPQGPKYAKLSAIKRAKTLDDVFRDTEPRLTVPVSAGST